MVPTGWALLKSLSASLGAVLAVARKLLSGRDMRMVAAQICSLQVTRGHRTGAAPRSKSTTHSVRKGVAHVYAGSVDTHKLRIRVSDDARYLTIGQVRERFGVSDMWVWRHMRDHGFPRPVQFGGPTSARHWLLTDIEQWERSKAVAS